MLVVSGDEDVSTQGVRRAALSRALSAQADLLVDVRGLAFADASLMLDLAMVARRLRKAGRRMFVHGAQPQIERLIEAVGLHRLPGVSIEGFAPSLS
ncbi:MAG TPA: STAS domain-containing protein [Solirubrobacteraceae bacterium]|nr:STAS domain-containing protein [Solirubrobacteraceae bacterium]